MGLPRQELLPKLLEAKDEREPLRLWSTGCASGEEAYTLAIVLAEQLGLEGFRARVKIYATDVDEDALAQGRHASDDDGTVEAVPEQLREKYFERVNSSYVFRADLRRSVIFGRHDLIHDPPSSRVDLLVSRNTLMYFDAETQEQILRSFHFALRDHGLLFLGRPSRSRTARKVLGGEEQQQFVLRPSTAGGGRSRRGSR